MNGQMMKHNGLQVSAPEIKYLSNIRKNKKKCIPLYTSIQYKRQEMVMIIRNSTIRGRQNISGSLFSGKVTNHKEQLFFSFLQQASGWESYQLLYCFIVGLGCQLEKSVPGALSGNCKNLLANKKLSWCAQNTKWPIT